MCTLSWRHRPGGYTLWFNRDELHTRAAEEPPVERRDPATDLAWLAPGDPDGGGTWLMVNARGLTAALLNDYEAADVRRSRTGGPSRGRLVPRVAGCASVMAALARLEVEELDETAPFSLVLLDAAGAVGRCGWDGKVRRVETGGFGPPCTSSSFAPRAVAEARRAAFPRSGDDAAVDAYHRRHETAAGAWSVNMARPDAATRSLCRVRVDDARVTLDYEPMAWPGAPLPVGGPGSWDLARVGAGIGQTAGYSQWP